MSSLDYDSKAREKVAAVSLFHYAPARFCFTRHLHKTTIVSQQIAGSATGLLKVHGLDRPT